MVKLVFVRFTFWEPNGMQHTQIDSASWSNGARLKIQSRMCLIEIEVVLSSNLWKPVANVPVRCRLCSCAQGPPQSTARHSTAIINCIMCAKICKLFCVCALTLPLKKSPRVAGIAGWTWQLNNVSDEEVMLFLCQGAGESLLTTLFTIISAVQYEEADLQNWIFSEL